METGLTSFFFDDILALKGKIMSEEKPSIIEKKKKPKDIQLSLNEYHALQEKEAKKFKGIKLPFAVKIILALPLIAIFLFGLFIIPFFAIRGCSNPSTPTTQNP